MATTDELKAIADQMTKVIPTVDYQVGVGANVVLKDYHTIGRSIPGVTYDAVNNRVLVTGNNVTLSGYNFAGTTVDVKGQNAKIVNCNFDASTGFFALKQENVASGMIVDHCTFDGGKLNRPEFADFVAGGAGKVTITNSVFKNSPADMINVQNGTVSHNYFTNLGYAVGPHADAIWVTNTTGPVTISDNFIDARALDAGQGANSALRITNELGSVSNVSVTSNVLLGGTYTIGVTEAAQNGAKISNVSISDNYVSGGQFGDLYSAHVPADLAYFDNTTGSMGSQSLQASSLFSGVSVTGRPSVTNDVLSGSAGGDHLYGHGGGDQLIGGLGGDWLYGGSGKDSFVYKTVNDSSPTGIDHIVNFENGIDKIDFSSFVDPNSGRAVHLHYVGERAFDGAANEIHLIVNANGQSMVEVDLNGDKRADMRIQLDGSHHLLASDFKL